MWLARIFNDFRNSAREMERVRALCATAMLTALQVILGALTITVGPSIQITFDYLPLCALSMFFGPVPAMISGSLADLLAFVIRPTGAFNPGFTLSAALNGLIYGLFFYRKTFDKPWKLPLCAVLSRLIAVVLCNICLNSLWLLWMYGQTAWTWIPGRVIKNVIEYPVSVVLLLAMQSALGRISRIISLK